MKSGVGHKKRGYPCNYVHTYLQYFSCSLPHTSLPLWPCSLAKHLVTGKEIAIELAKGIPRTTHVYVPHEAREGEGKGGAAAVCQGRTPHHTTHNQSYPR